MFFTKEEDDNILKQIAKYGLEGQIWAPMIEKHADDFQPERRPCLLSQRWRRYLRDKPKAKQLCAELEGKKYWPPCDQVLPLHQFPACTDKKRGQKWHRSSCAMHTKEYAAAKAAEIREFVDTHGINETQECIECGLTVPDGVAFHRNNKYWDGLDPRCANCYKVKKTDIRLVTEVRCRAKKYGFDFPPKDTRDPEEQQLLDRITAMFWEACVFCGRSPVRGKDQANGIDRLESEWGYTLDNIAPSCGLCNVMKKTVPQLLFITMFPLSSLFPLLRFVQRHEENSSSITFHYHD